MRQAEIPPSITCLNCLALLDSNICNNSALLDTAQTMLIQRHLLADLTLFTYLKDMNLYDFR